MRKDMVASAGTLVFEPECLCEAAGIGEPQPGGIRNGAGKGFLWIHLTYMDLLYCPPTSYNALLIWPREQVRTVLRSSSKTLPPSRASR